MNDRIEDLLNGLSGHVAVLDRLMIVTARDVVFLAAVVLLGLWFWPAGGAGRALNQRVAAVAALAVLLALGVGSALGRLHQEARPFVSDSATRLLVPHAADNGFPSDHAVLSFALAGAIVWWRRLVGGVVLAAAVLVGIARVYVGVHWPSEIVAGAAIGFAAGMLAARTVPWWTGLQRSLARFLPPVLLARPEPVEG